MASAANASCFQVKDSLVSDAETYSKQLVQEAANKKNNINYGSYSHWEYSGSLSPSSMTRYAVYVMTMTGAGAGIGAACGSAAGGLGAGPGAAIGAGVGLTVGLTTASVYRVATSYIQWRASQQKAIVTDMYEKFKTFAKKQGEEMFECPITSNCPPLEPVKTPHSNHVYERAALEAWIDTHGTCPTTRKPLKKEDLRFSICTMAHATRICDEIINHHVKDSNMSSKQIEGLKELSQDLKSNLMSFFKKESSHLSDKVHNKEMDFREYANQMTLFARAAQPERLQNDGKGNN